MEQSETTQDIGRVRNLLFLFTIYYMCFSNELCVSIIELPLINILYFKLPVVVSRLKFNISK